MWFPEFVRLTLDSHDSQKLQRYFEFQHIDHSKYFPLSLLLWNHVIANQDAQNNITKTYFACRDVLMSLFCQLSGKFHTGICISLGARKKSDPPCDLC